MADGAYGAGLFDSTGPKGFADAIGTISTNLGGVTSAFQTFGSNAAASLSTVSKAITDLVNQLGQVQNALTGMSTGAGGGNGGNNTSQQAANIPAPQQQGPTAGPQWKPGGTPSPNAQTGTADQLAGMPQGTAADPSGWWSKVFNTVPTGSASGAGLTMGQRAAQSMIPAAVGGAANYAGGLTAAAVQGSTIGQMYGPMFGVSAQSLYQQPAGWMGQNPQAYGQTAYMAMNDLSLSPGTQNFSTIMGVGGSVNQLTSLLPGSTAQQRFQTTAGNQDPTKLNQALGFGFNFKPGGQIMSQQSMDKMAFDRWSKNLGGKPTAKQVQEFLQPGNPWLANLSQELGWSSPNDVTQFRNFALDQVGATSKGQTLGNLGTKAGMDQTTYSKTASFAEVNRQSTQSRVEQQAEPALAEAAKNLNNAATSLLNAVAGPAGALGGFAAATQGSMAGSLGSLGVQAAGMYVGGKLIKKAGKKVLGRAMTVKKGSSLWGKVKSLTGKTGDAEAVGADTAEAGELATAGLGSSSLVEDVSVVGAPIGIAQGVAAAGLAAYAARGQIGSAAKSVGHFFGGLFGGGSEAGAATPRGAASDSSVSTLLTQKPPTKSVLDILTAPPAAGSTIAKSGGGSSSGTMSPQTGGLDSGMFGGTSSTSSGGASSSIGGGSASSAVSGSIPAGGSYDPNSWATALLTALGAPTNAANTNSVVTWESREGGNWNNTAKYNPLNTSYKMPGSASMGGGSNVQAYASWQQGLQATVDTLNNGKYTDIMTALKAGKGLSGGTFPGLSTWSDGAYSSLARGTQLVARTQLALLHRGEAVIPAADNYSSSSYNQNGSVGSGGGAVHLNFKAGSVVLQVPPSASQQDMETLANQFVAAIAKPNIIASVRSS